MPAPKTLEEHVRDASFRARRHRDLLATSPALPWRQLAALQSAFAATDHELERRSLAVAFERAVRELDVDENELAERERAERELRELLDAEPVEVDLDALAAELDRSTLATWRRDLRRSGLSYRAI